MRRRVQPHLLSLALLCVAAVLPLDLAAQTKTAKPAATAAPAAERAVLRVACDDDNVGATVTVNGQFKGECPVDITIEAGALTLRAVKPVDETHERIFEQRVTVAGGTGKRIDVALTPPQLTAEAQARENQRVKEAQQRAAETRQRQSEARAAAIQAATEGGAAAMFAMGQRYERGDATLGLPINPAEAAAWYRKAADAGSGAAAAQLGPIYENAIGVPADRALAMAYVKKAAELNDPRGLGLWALMGFERKSAAMQPQAAALLRRAAEAGDPYAQNAIGGLPEEASNAKTWWRKAADGFRRLGDEGDYVAMFMLGLYYHSGMGVERDLAQFQAVTKKAITLAEKSAAAGDPMAAYQIGMAHYNLSGIVSKEDVSAEKAAAVAWMNKAAVLGLPGGAGIVTSITNAMK